LQQDIRTVKPVDLALVMAINLIWGFTFIAGKTGLNEMPPVWFTGLRFAMLAVFLLPALRIVRGQMVRILAVAMFCGALHFCLMYTALKMAHDVSTIAIASQLNLPFAVIMAVLILGERITLLRIGGIVAAFGGVIVIGFDPHVFNYAVALILVTLAALSMALAQVMMRELKGVGIFTLQAWVALVSAPSLMAASFVMESGQVEAMRQASLLAWAALSYTAIGSSLIGFGGMYYLLRRYPVSLVTPMFLLAPIFAVVFGVTLLGDTLTLRILIGGAITLAGVLVTTLAPAAKPAES